ncbi:hypothetical protein TRIATDRAFT_301407 [Trichoderma atroviride IMI 206040]|uniref:Uncharacterized protein n=1 Tax=Hypocrea atroviridis (strain ATCC 20476 / IMI 206040) TaxID=452589 RepID=G9P619_HYPAI|nr:uncharacterized protein TRIATDRAFT_301407 [Trichoderma atroviride IMI 206040]EHK40573.1 hypothetical protein TRIATDRAFT_301407 [Trichoderma atroviride IMI 206040]
MEKGNGDFVSVCPTCGRLADFFLVLGGPYVSGMLGRQRFNWIGEFSFRQTKREVGKKGTRNGNVLYF